jgi:hypothetical protein
MRMCAKMGMFDDWLNVNMHGENPLKVFLKTGIFIVLINKFFIGFRLCMFLG